MRNSKNERVYNENETKIAYEEYFKELFTHNIVEPEAIKWTQTIEQQLSKFLKNRDFEEIELNKPLIPKEIKEVFKHLKLNKAPGPDNLLNEFIQKGGKELQETLINIFIEIYNTEQIAKDWNKTNIISIYKGKGNIEDLKPIVASPLAAIY